VHPRRLALLRELARRGTMRAVADATGQATSAVSQQLAVLEREAGVRLLERAGRNVRLTPAGRTLVGHADTVLAALDAARADLITGGEPSGVVRVASYATALRRLLVPLAADLPAEHPRVQLELQEREPDEVDRLLAGDEIDLGVIYDFDLAPRRLEVYDAVSPLEQRGWSLAVPDEPGLLAAVGAGTPLGAVRERAWIVNSRGPDDERVVERLCALDGYLPDVRHRADSLDLVADLVAAGLGVALLPSSTSTRPGVRLVELTGPRVQERSYVVAGPGRARWPATALVVERLVAAASSS
jgi:DNA-binding transcriptional LysR family regulator